MQIIYIFHVYYVTEFIQTDLRKPLNGSYEKINFKDFQTGKDCEHVNGTYTKGGPFHYVWELS